MALAAWKLNGQGWNALNGAIIRDPGRAKPMYIISHEQYVSERTAHFDKSKPKSKGPNVERSDGNQWNVSCVPMVQWGAP